MSQQANQIIEAYLYEKDESEWGLWPLAPFVGLTTGLNPILPLDFIILFFSFGDVSCIFNSGMVKHHQTAFEDYL